MTTNEDFNFFLQHGYIEGIPPGESMKILLKNFGDSHWYTKEIENNGLTYGIIKVGFIEFHIYDEKIIGISYRPDVPYNKGDFQDGSIPWISEFKEISDIENILTNRQIVYSKYSVQGPLKTYQTAGAALSNLERTNTFIDTIGGVTFIFEQNMNNNQLEAYQVCKYYSI